MSETTAFLMPSSAIRRPVSETTKPLGLPVNTLLLSSKTVKSGRTLIRDG